jgi:hypothetical protein
MSNFVKIISGNQTVQGTNGQGQIIATATSNNTLVDGYNYEGLTNGFWISNGGVGEIHTHSMSVKIAGARLRINATENQEPITFVLDGVQLNLNSAIANGSVIFNNASNNFYTIDSNGRFVGSGTSTPANAIATLTFNIPFTVMQINSAGSIVAGNMVGQNGTVYEFFVDTDPQSPCLSTLSSARSLQFSNTPEGLCGSDIRVVVYLDTSCGFNVGCNIFSNQNCQLATDGFYAELQQQTVLNPPPRRAYQVANGIITKISDCSNLFSSSSSSSISELPIEESGCLTNYYGTNDTEIRIISDRGDLIDNNFSWVSNSGIFNQYGYTNKFSSNNTAGAILNLKNDTEFFVTAGLEGNIFSGLGSGMSGYSSYLVEYATKKPYDPILNYNRTKQQVTIKQFKYQNTGFKATFAFDESWAEYELTGLMNSNNAFSWSYNIVENMRISGIFFEEAAQGLVDPVDLYLRKFTPKISKNLINYFDSFQTVCKFKIGCDVEIDEPEPKTALICWTGTDVQSDDFRKWLKQKLEENIDIIGRPPEAAVDLLETVGLELYFTTVSGYLLYNTWVTGEQIIWNLYNFDFPKTYKLWHQNNNPPYPSTGFALTYPNHWNSIDSLVDVLNSKLNDPVSYPVWYPYPCTSGEFSGVFINGPLMRFWKNTGTTGDGLPLSHVNNRIDFVSYRNLPQITIKNEFLTKKNELMEYAGGKKIPTGNAVQSVNAILDTSYQFEVLTFDKTLRGPKGYQGFRYLIPNNIVLEGLNRSTNLWETLDVIDFKEDYENLLPTDKITVKLDQFITGTISQNLIDSFVSSGAPEPLGLEAFLQTTCSYRDLFQFNKIEETNTTKNIYCPPVRQETLVKFIWPDNCPPYAISGNKIIEVDNVYWCKPEPESLQKTICPEPIPIACPEGFYSKKMTGDDLDVGECPYFTCAPSGRAQQDTRTPIPTEFTIIRTGSNFSINAGFNDPYNNQDNLDLLCGEDLLFLSYKKFKVRLINFFMPQEKREKRGGGTATGPKELLPLYPQNKFFIHNINFTDALNVPFSGHVAAPECLLGADYLVDVSGLTPLRFTGIYDIYVTGDSKNESGSYRFQNVPLIRKVEDNEKWIKFNKVSGYIYDESGVGALNETIYLSGLLCYNFDETPYYFYDPETTIVSFTKYLCNSGDVYRTGVVSGSAIIVKPSVINRELLVGGRYNTPVDYYQVTQDSLVTTTLRNTPYKAYNVTGIYNISGIVTGLAKNGVFEANLNPFIRPF